MQPDTDTFHPTIDELRALKRLELGPVTVSAALHDHLPQRLYELGYIAKNAAGELSLTARGLALVRRR